MNKIRGTPKNTHYNPDHREKHTMPLHTFTTILQISAGIMILYGIRDEYKRYRDKKKGKIVKRLPRLEGAATIFRLHLPRRLLHRLIHSTPSVRMAPQLVLLRRRHTLRSNRNRSTIPLRNKIPQHQPRRHHHLPHLDRTPYHHPKHPKN